MSAQFDSLAYANRLKNAGVDEKQAEIQAETLLQVVNDQLLTKYDLKETKTELNQNIKDLKTELVQEIRGVDLKIKEVEVKLTQEIQEVKRDIKELEMRLVIKLSAVLTVVMGVLFKFLH